GDVGDERDGFAAGGAARLDRRVAAARAGRRTENARARRGQLDRDRAADPAGRPGHQGDATVQREGVADHQRSRTCPQAMPAPKATMHTILSLTTRPCSTASVSAIGTDAAEVLP